MNTKYQLLLDLNPEYARYPHFIPPEEYKDLELELKQEYLDELKEYKWKHLKYIRKQPQKEASQEEKLMKDLEVIEKKSIIREMQDKLYRKMMQKNVKI